MAKTRHKGITRVDLPDHHMVGYYVRVNWNGQKRAKFVSDGRHGDRLAALDEAIRLRDAFERELGKPRTDRLIFGRHTRNTSGEPGIRRLKENGTWYWEASYSIGPGYRKTTRFSERKHGKRGAKLLARRFRAMGEAERRRSPFERVARRRVPRPRRQQFDGLRAS